METERSIIVEKNRSQNNLPEKHAVKEFRMWPHTLKWGAGAGLVMGLYLLLIHAVGAGDIIALKFLKHIILFGFLGYGLNKYREVNKGHSFFQEGIYLGALTTFISAVSLIAIDIVVGLMAPDFSFSKFNKEAETPMDFFVINGAIFFEILVFGMIITFIWLQYLKRKVDEDAVNNKH